jgi:HK97 family phage major capsid protein
MDRDDIIDITDFDVVAWIRGEMRVMLNEELARAILFGDGRLSSSDDKINEQNIRPIWTDHELFTIQKQVTFAANATEDDKAKALIKTAVKARKDYRGAGNPTCYMTEDMLTDMLLLEDGIGHRLYKTEAEVASAMRVSRIVTVPIMENLTRTVDGTVRTLQAIIVNLSDYQVGTDRGGEIKSYEQFDIDYNQQKYLLETRCSGALITPYSAIVIESVPQA